MVVRGAPDHTVLIEQNFAHYKDVVTRENVTPVSAAPTWDTILNVAVVGVWGYMWAWTDSLALRLRITIDGEIVFYMTVNEMKGGGFWGAQNAWGKFGLTKFQDVAGDLSYGLFYDERWGLYIHESLKIELQRAGAIGTQASWGIYYKELQ